MNARYRQSGGLQLRGLVIHQRDQWADHQSRPVQGDGGKLIAQRLSRAGRHHQQQITPFDGCPADLFLAFPEVIETEGLPQKGPKISGGALSHRANPHLRINQAVEDFEVRSFVGVFSAYE
ncbi:MAG: hypothetical protein JF584_08325 [Acidobacteria bacterium]|nr:hypothetical protein [Acidobacteriota bacterium]